MHHRSPTRLIGILLAGAVSLLAAGCGGASHTAGTATGSNTLIAYSHCMRSHGVPAFPDPTASQGIPKDRIPVSSPQFASASSACQHLMPATGLGPQSTAAQQRTRLADGLSFARCMRSRGVVRFPDPTASGALSLQMVEAQGVDVHSLSVLHTAEACVPASHGALTAATVREVLNGAGG